MTRRTTTSTSGGLLFFFFFVRFVIVWNIFFGNYITSHCFLVSTSGISRSSHHLPSSFITFLNNNIGNSVAIRNIPMMMAVVKSTDDNGDAGSCTDPLLDTTTTKASSSSTTMTKTTTNTTTTATATTTAVTTSTQQATTTTTTTKNNNVFHCQLCGPSCSFPSRNKLFDHLRQQHSNNNNNNNNNNATQSSFDTTTTTTSSTTFDAHDRTVASIEVRSKLRSIDHEGYYRLQCTDGNNVMTMSELETTLEYFRRPLPVSFRLSCRANDSNNDNEDDDDDNNNNNNNNNKNNDDDDSREEYVRYLIDTCTTSTQIQASPYFSSHTVRVANIPPREWSHIAQQAFSDGQGVGAVYRQELCSMVPSKLLLMDLINKNNDDDDDDDHDDGNNIDDDISTTHPTSNRRRITILDLCAAPGSKTLLLLEELHRRRRHHRHFRGSMLVANDSNRTRLLTLARLSRISRGRTHLVLNSSDGRYFPSLRKWGGYKVKFDRILADVPCSGDGTFRKLPQKDWTGWNVRSHLQLHKLQLRLLIRALQLVKKGGRVVYSTCSLDPIENEAVVASAIGSLGVDLYRIVPIPSNYHLDVDATQPVPFSKGATRWSVPHPKFTTDGNMTIMYRRYYDVPPDLTKRHILPTMFPPSTRYKADNNNSTDPEMSSGDDDDANVDDDDDRTGETSEGVEEEDDNSHDGTTGARRKLRSSSSHNAILRRKDAIKLDTMLSDCCRILPQHLDSGGFFCAIIERISPSYFAICCPSQRGMMIEPFSSSLFHGRIYHPVHSPDEFRTMIQQERDRTREEIYFEGHPTLETAIQWLHQHGAFNEERSHVLLKMPEQHLTNNESMVHEQKESDDVDTGSLSTRIDTTKENVKGLNRPPIYTPLFRRPHPKLVSEFCDFYGLYQNPDDAAKAGVNPFPVEDIVLLGSNDKAPDVTTCIDITQVDDTDTVDDTIVRGFRQYKFFQLSIVSKEIQCIFAGGAKFHPMEAGLVLTWVPIPESGYGRQKCNPGNDQSGLTSVVEQQNDQTPRSMKSGRYGLLDEAAEMVGRHATRRILDLSSDHFIQLLQTSSMVADHVGIEDWPAGGIIVRYTMANDSSSKIYISCSLQRCLDTGKKRLYLLSEQRLADSWLRLVRARTQESLMLSQLC